MSPPVETPVPVWKAVFHRWFVQYNPLYLVSATLILVGLTLLMEATVGRGGVLGQLSSTVVAELYAWALIGSAALLTRRGLWRPAVMLALITALYQCDLTLQTERSVYLGLPGVVASAAWLIGFVAKLQALAWAMQLRLSRSATAVATFGALSAMSIPWILDGVHSRAATPIVGLLVFGVLAAGMWTSRSTESWHPRSAWADTVATRSARVIWLGWAVALVAHVLFLTEHGPSLDHGIIAPIAFVLLTRGLRSERMVWAWLGATLLVVAVFAPLHFAATAVMVSVAFALRAFRQPTPVSPALQRLDPYRSLDEVPRWPIWTLARSSPAAMERLLAAAWTCLYLAAWTAQWRGGPWPDHVLWLDAVFLTSAVVWTWRSRSPNALLPAALSLAHWIVLARVVPTPQSSMQWSLTAIGLGFAMLTAGLGVSVRLRTR